ncbi:MAG TPA: phosphate regulon sensor histidine kinase PhoR [Aquimonas sp.]|nr:phosphate regulon sensor histidine kinase PhoR [Aquimonas sp.]HRF53279.1 phosphate regulon sensor histidine kinase PhoR [Aquimonas sp.]
MARDLSRPWQYSLLRVGMVLALGMLIGLLIGTFWAGVSLALLAVLIWQYLRLHRVLQRLHSRERLHLPEGRGIWSDLDAVLYVRQREGARRKRRLLRALRSFRQAAAALPDAVLVLDRRDLGIQWFNESAVRLLGLQPRRDIGVRFLNLVRAPRVHAWFESGAVEPLIDLPSPQGDGSRLSMRLLEYTPELYLLVARDVSKLLQLEQMRQDFVANASHELRTPLTVLHGYLDMLDPEDVPEWGGLLLEMRRQSLRMTQVVEDLLTLSRLDACERLPEDPIDMRAMLRTLARDADGLSNGGHTIRVLDGAQCDLLGSSKELHSAFSNLVSNAVRYTPKGGEVRIELQATPDGGVSLCVQDTGPGIAADHLPRITERFYRVSNSRSRESGGTGLGLSIVKHVVQLHQAELKVHSEVGKGSRFCVIFPRDRVLPRDAEVDNPA